MWITEMRYAANRLTMANIIKKLPFFLAFARPRVTIPKAVSKLLASSVAVFASAGNRKQVQELNLYNKVPHWYTTYNQVTAVHNLGPNQS